MATLCLRKLTLRNCLGLRQFYANERVIITAPLLINNDLRLNKYSTLRSTCSYTKLVRQPNSIIFRNYSEKIGINPEERPPEKKKSLLQRFKQMYRDYWYVLVPVHLVTSAGWFGGFYYLAKSGVDIVGILQAWHVSETITNSLKDSSMGYLAVSYALYKLATPARYTVTLGGTTISINYLKRWGYIKPVPSTEQLKEMYKERRDNVMESFREKTEFYKEKKDNLMEHVRETKIELKAQKDQLKDQKDLLVKDLEKSLEKIKKAKADLSGKSDNFIKISKKGDGG